MHSLPTLLSALTFPLALLGYLGLTATALLTAWRATPVLLWRATAVVICLHVFLVWHTRYDWVFDTAVRNGYAGFLLFHAALLAILAATVVRNPLHARFIQTAFLVVSAGATGAVFRYQVVVAYRPVVLFCATTGLIGLALAARMHRAAKAS